ncbi:MAG: PEP-CTERM sorting domain-containing protein [Candidatus Acidiferrales bacterium]
MSWSRPRGELVLRFLVAALIAGAILLAPATLRADTYVTYTLSPGDTLADGSPISGTFTVDTTTSHVNGTITIGSLIFNAINDAMGCPGSNCSYDGFTARGAGGSYVLLSWIHDPSYPSPLTFYSPYSFCQGCVSTGYDHLTSGATATDPMPTPEPATALMLLVGLAGVPLLRRRRSNA